MPLHRLIPLFIALTKKAKNLSDQELANRSGIPYERIEELSIRGFDPDPRAATGLTVREAEILIGELRLTRADIERLESLAKSRIQNTMALSFAKSIIRYWEKEA